MVVKTKTVYVGVQPYDEFFDGYNAQGQPVITTNHYSRTSVELVRTRDGTSLPRWRDVIRAGGSATTGMTGTDNRVTIIPGSHHVYMTEDLYNPNTGKWQERQSWGGGVFANPGSVIVNNPVIDLTSATNQARTRFLDALRQQNTHVQSGIAIGEMRETWNGLGKLVKEVASVLPKHLYVQNKFLSRKLGKLVIGPNGSPVRATTEFDTQRLSRTRKVPKPKRLPPGDWKDVRKELADRWLEFSFGLRPLLGDIRDHAEAIARFQNDEKHSRIRGYGTSQAYISSGDVNLGGMVNLSITGHDKVTEQAEVILRGGLVFSLSSPAFGTVERLTDLLGFKLEDFVPTVWNLLPYSFLLDYFINVGDLLSAITTDTSAVRWVNVSEVRRRKYERNITGAPQIIVGKSGNGGGNLGGYLMERRRVTRYADGVQYPQPEIKIPSFTNEKGEFNQQLLNILALVSGGSGGHR